MNLTRIDMIVLCCVMVFTFATHASSQDAVSAQQDVAAKTIDFAKACDDDRVTDDLTRLVALLEEKHAAFVETREIARWQEHLLEIEAAIRPHETARSLLLRSMLCRLMYEAVAVELQGSPDEQRLDELDELLGRFEVKPPELRRFCPEGDDPPDDSADMITWWRYVRECHGKAPNQLRLNERSEVRREPLVASALALGYLPAIEDIVLSRVTDIDLTLDSLFKTEVYGVRGVLLAIEFLRRGGDPNDIDRRLVFSIAATHKKFEDLKSMNVSPIRVEGTLRHDPARIGPEKELSIFTGVFSRYAERVPAVRSR